VFLGKAVQTVNPPNGSVGTAQIADLAVTSGKLASGVLPDNTPAFYAYVNGSAQSVSANTITKVTLNGTLLDTDSAFSSSKFTVPSSKAGNYFISASSGYNSATDWDNHFVFIYKNGAAISKVSNRQEYDTLNKTSVVTTLAVGDYIELYVNQESGSSQNLRTPSSEVYLQGFKLIG